jgi:multidrug efflux pump subunit AcrB
MRRWIAGALALILIGGIAAALAWCSSDPPLPSSTVSVTVAARGLDALVIEREIVVPIEESLRSIEGASLRSVSRSGVGTVTLVCGSDPDATLIAEVRDRVSALGQVHAGAEPPTVSRFATPALTRWFTIGGDRRRANETSEALRRRLEAISLTSARVSGATEPEVRVELDLDRMNAMAISLTDVLRALDQSAASPAGRIDSHELRVGLSARESAADLADLVVTAGERVVRVRDVATVSETLARPSRAWSGEEIVAVGAFVMPWADPPANDVDAAAAELEGVRPFGRDARLETGRLLTPAGTSLEERWRLAREIGPELRALPGVSDVLVLVERDVTRIVLARSTPSASREDLEALLRTVARHPGAAYVADDAHVRVRVACLERAQAFDVATELRERLRRTPDLFGAELLDRNEPEVAFRVDHARIADAGVSLRDVVAAFETSSAEGLAVANVVTGDGESTVRVRVDTEGDPTRVTRLTFAGASGPVRLDALASLENRFTPSRLLRVDRQPSAELDVVGDPSEDTDERFERVERVARSTELPAGCSIVVDRDLSQPGLAIPSEQR